MFYEPVLDPNTGKQKRLTPTESELRGISDIKAGNKEWKFSKPTKEEFMSWIKAEGRSWTTVGTRKDMLARILAREIALDATMEVLQNPEQPDFDLEGNPTGRTIDVLERMDVSHDDYNDIQVIATVADIISRDPRTKFSLRSNYKFQREEILDLIFERSETLMERMRKRGEGSENPREMFSDAVVQAVIETYSSNLKDIDAQTLAKVAEALLDRKFKHTASEFQDYSESVLRVVVETNDILSQNGIEEKFTRQEQAALLKQIIENKDRINLKALKKKNHELSLGLNNILKETFGIRSDKHFDDYTAYMEGRKKAFKNSFASLKPCLLYTSDAADE